MCVSNVSGGFRVVVVGQLSRRSCGKCASRNESRVIAKYGRFVIYELIRLVRRTHGHTIRNRTQSFP